MAENRAGDNIQTRSTMSTQILRPDLANRKPLPRPSIGRVRLARRKGCVEHCECHDYSGSWMPRAMGERVISTVNIFRTSISGDDLLGAWLTRVEVYLFQPSASLVTIFLTASVLHQSFQDGHQTLCLSSEYGRRQDVPITPTLFPISTSRPCVSSPA